MGMLPSSHLAHGDVAPPHLAHGDVALPHLASWGCLSPRGHAHHHLARGHAHQARPARHAQAHLALGDVAHGPHGLARVHLVRHAHQARLARHAHQAHLARRARQAPVRGHRAHQAHLARHARQAPPAHRVVIVDVDITRENRIAVITNSTS